MADRLPFLTAVGSAACALSLFATGAAHAAAQTADVAADSDFVWIEGEDADRREVTPHGWYNGVRQDVLSENAWLSHFDENREGHAAWDFSVATTDDYTFWLRANPVAARLSWKLDDADWQAVDFDGDLRGRINIAADNKPDLRFIAWVRVGTVRLTAGQHTLAVRMHSGPQNHGGIDCFVLSRVPFVPSGTARPTSGSSPAAPDEWFPVIMDHDPLSEDSVIDVSHLVEAPAGEYGFLQRDGADLRFERAAAASKFWGVNAHPLGDSPEQMQRAARWLRKHGINLVRQHTVIDTVGLLDRNGRFDAERLDRYDRWFAALRAEGIYTTWSVVYPHHGAFLRPHEVPEALFAELDADDASRDGARQPIVVNDYINLDRRIQDAAWQYFDTLLNHVNPWTGLAYRDDPALAIVEIQNESNVFFFTLNSLLDDDRVPGLSRKMRQRFFEFAQAKYGTEAAARRAWGSLQPADDWAAGELALMGAHHWGSDGPQYEYAGRTRRCGDYIAFLTGIQRDYYERTVRRLRETGFRGVTVATAWKSGGPAASLANLYCDTAADAIDRHNYFGGGAGGHGIAEGRISQDTHLSQPGHGLLAMGLFQVHDRPFVSSEWSQMPPNPWKAEAAPLLACYGLGLQGWDASCHFSLGNDRLGDGWPDQGKYATHTPHYLGQFPALAFAVHNRHIREGDVVALRAVSEAGVFAGRDVLGQALSGGGFDEKELVGDLQTPPWALACGRVTIDFRGDSTSHTSLGECHNAGAKQITSHTGQLVWDYGNRVVEVRTPKTQAVIGFAGGTTVDLPSVRAAIRTPFVSLVFTPLDNHDLHASRLILITAMARDRQTGSEFSEDGAQLLRRGSPPLLMEPVQATIRLAGDRPVEVRPLHFDGTPRDATLPLQSSGSFTIDGTARTYYYLVRR